MLGKSLSPSPFLFPLPALLLLSNGVIVMPAIYIHLHSHNRHPLDLSDADYIAVSRVLTAEQGVHSNCGQFNGVERDRSDDIN